MWVGVRCKPGIVRLQVRSHAHWDPRLWGNLVAPAHSHCYTNAAASAVVDIHSCIRKLGQAVADPAAGAGAVVEAELDRMLDLAEAARKPYSEPGSPGKERL